MPIKNSKKDESDRVVDLLVWKNYYALIKKLKVFLGNLYEKFIFRRCLNSYTSENMILIHNQNVKTMI